MARGEQQQQEDDGCNFKSEEMRGSRSSHLNPPPLPSSFLAFISFHPASLLLSPFLSCPPLLSPVSLLSLSSGLVSLLASPHWAAFPGSWPQLGGAPGQAGQGQTKPCLPPPPPPPPLAGQRWPTLCPLSSVDGMSLINSTLWLPLLHFLLPVIFYRGLDGCI